MKPSVGRIVHYVAYGTPGGEYPKACRAAIITEVDATSGDAVEGPIIVGLCVLNPSGQFFNPRVSRDQSTEPVGGTWHWPERVE